VPKWKASQVWVEKLDQVEDPCVEFGKAVAAGLGMIGVPDDPCLDPLEPGGEVVVPVQSLAEHGESYATSLPGCGVVRCDHELADGPLVTCRHVEDRIEVVPKKHSPDHGQQFDQLSVAAPVAEIEELVAVIADP
jgi:hypothetical protein